MKAKNLQSLGREEHMMMRWMCGVSLKDRKRSEVLYGLLGVQSVAEEYIYIYIYFSQNNHSILSYKQ